MLIKKEHALALYNIKANEDKGISCQIRVLSESEPYIELNLANMVDIGSSSIEYRLSYWGANLLANLEEMVKNSLISYPSSWSEHFRWIGSEVIGMIEASLKNDDLCGEEIADALIKRGFAEKVSDRDRGECVKINRFAKAIYEIYQNSHPKILINKELANFIVSMGEGPASTHALLKGGREVELLESQRLISFSMPNSDVYTLNLLGKEVKETLNHCAIAFDTIISEDYLHSLEKLLDLGIDSLSDGERETLEALAFIDENGELLKAGEHLFNVLHILREKDYKKSKTFNLEALDEEIIRIIPKIEEVHKSNPEIIASADEIKHYLLEMPLKEYKAVKEHYGRRLNEAMGYQKKEELRKKFAEALSVEELFKHFYEKGNEWEKRLMDVIEESLYTLESFSLVAQGFDEKKQKGYYYLTDEGKEVLADLNEKGVREISAPAVKAITVANTEFGAPNVKWFEDAQSEHLVGGGAPTKSGKLYASLAYRVKKLPHISRFELMILHKIPKTGYFVEDIYKDFDETLKEEVTYGLNKLEARGFIDILPNDALILTEAGENIKLAVAGVPESMGNPVTPDIVRILQTLKEIGNLYVKEQKVRILPKNIKTAISILKMDKERFDKALVIARGAKYIGKSSINEAGMRLLKAFELVNE